MAIPILLLTILAVTSSSLRHQTHHSVVSHLYWFNKDNPKNIGNDSRWNYCDLKCLYLERYYINKDFVVLVLTAPLR
jgi:hypothetical protein